MPASAALVPIGPQPVDYTQNEYLFKVKVTFSGTYSATSNHGDLCSLLFSSVPSSRVPTQVDFFEAPPAGTAPTGYQFVYCPGTDITSGRICVLQSGAAVSSPNAEITQNAAYPGALTGTTYIYAFVTVPAY